MISGARVVDPGSGLDGDALDVRIQNGVIAEIGHGLEAAEKSSTPRGLTVLPGLIDPHVHLRTPGQELKEDIESGTRAAAAGGFAAILAMPNTSPTVDSVPVFEGLIARAHAQARGGHGLHRRDQPRPRRPRADRYGLACRRRRRGVL